MKIFVLLSRIPWPLEKGDKLRAFNQIKSLSRNHEIFLCALNDDASVDKNEAKQRLLPYCKEIEFIDLPKIKILWNLALAFLKGMPIQCGYFYNKNAHSCIHNFIQRVQPDMLYGQLVRVAPYLQKEKCKKTIDYQDVLSYGMKRRMDTASFYKRPIFNMEYKRLQQFERQIFDEFDVKTIISDSDRQLIDHPRRNEILIVPNGVDFEHFTQKDSSKIYDVVFTGNMAYPPNVDAVDYLSREIMPIVWQTRPETSLCLAGATPAASVKAVANDKITVTGWVDDMRDVYAQSRIFIAPMRIGTGLQNKLLEALAMELPCITSPLANKSLQASENEEILVGKSPQELADAIVRLLNDEDFAQSIALKGNNFVHSHYDWDKTTALLEEAIRCV